MNQTQKLSKIKRYELPTNGLLQLPVGSRTICVDFYQGKIHLSVFQPQDDYQEGNYYPIEERKFNVYLDGATLNSETVGKLKFIGSIIFQDTQVFYIFEVLK